MKRIFRWKLFRASFRSEQTMGYMDVIEGNTTVISQMRTLEQEMSNNEPNDSCIMPGCYVVVPYTSPKFGKCFKILDVPRRTDILFHVLNYNRQSRGCIGVGLSAGHLDSDGYEDILCSGDAMGALVDMCWHDNAKILLEIT